MKVAANEVERTVLLAQTEIEQNDSPDRSSLDMLIEAFKRAAQLRDTPLFAALVRGTKDNVRRMVLVTTQEKTENGLRVLCLMPYTQAEEDGRRRTRPKYLRRRGELVSLLPSFYHELWTRKDRLEMVS